MRKRRRRKWGRDVRKAEFDKFADEYLATHTANIRASGESPAYFAEYKIKDIAAALRGRGPIKDILDFGGGIGASVPYVRQHFPDAVLTCLDVSNRSLDLARDRHGESARFVHFDGHEIPFSSNTFDVAFAACVFHHIDAAEHNALLRELWRVLRPGGHAFVFEHNPYNPLTRHAVNTCEFDKNALLITGQSMRRAFKTAGFRGARLRYRIFFPRRLSALRGVEPYLTWLPLGAQYFVVGTRAILR